MINYTMRSLFTDLKNTAANQPDKIALLDNNGRTLTYLQLLNQIESTHARLSSIGMIPGDDVLVALMPNAIETVILFLASLRGGYLYAPLPCM